MRRSPSILKDVLHVGSNVQLASYLGPCLGCALACISATLQMLRRRPHSRYRKGIPHMRALISDR